MTEWQRIVFRHESYSIQMEGISQTQVMELKKIVEEKRHDILDAWRKHFAG